MTRISGNETAKSEIGWTSSQDWSRNKKSGRKKDKMGLQVQERGKLNKSYGCVCTPFRKDIENKKS